jgi:hypothetical protein
LRPKTFDRVSGKLYRYPCIVVTMTDEDVVSRAAILINSKVSNLKASKPGGKPQFRATIRGKYSIELMKKLYPLMGDRRKRQLDIIFDFEAKRIDLNESHRLLARESSKGRKRSSSGQFIKEINEIS